MLLSRLTPCTRTLAGLGSAVTTQTPQASPPPSRLPITGSRRATRSYQTSFTVDDEITGTSYPWLLAGLGATGVLIATALSSERDQAASHDESRGRAWRIVPSFEGRRSTAFAAEDDAAERITQHDRDFDEFVQHESFVQRLDGWISEIDALLASSAERKQVCGSLLARKARLLYKKATETPGIHVVDKQVLIYRAFDCAEQALALNDEDWFVHKWFAIVITSIGDYEGNKRKLENAYLIKEHLARSLELNPTDPTTFHALGTWYFTFADMGWVMRNLAAAIFATPPQGTYEEALECFLRAEEISPGFYLKNNLYIVKTYLGMGNKERAAHWKAIGEQMTVSNEDDRAAFAELKKLSV